MDLPRPKEYKDVLLSASVASRRSSRWPQCLTCMFIFLVFLSLLPRSVFLFSTIYVNPNAFRVHGHSTSVAAASGRAVGGQHGKDDPRPAAWKRLHVKDHDNKTVQQGNKVARNTSDVAAGELSMAEIRLQILRRAVEAVRRYRSPLRLSSARRRKGATVAEPRSCEGRGVFVYDLPSKFNYDFLAHCNDIIPWMDLCKYFPGNTTTGAPILALGSAWRLTYQYGLEPIFHQRILNHPCRVLDQKAAKLFYVPFYGALDVYKWHFRKVTADVKDALGKDLLQWLEAQPTWARRSGKDHMFVLGTLTWDFKRNFRAWGSNLLLLEQMHKPMKFLIERDPWNTSEIGVPYPTHFHPRGDADVAAWQSRIMESEREILVSFAGAGREEAAKTDADVEDVAIVRSILIRQCLSSKGLCCFLNCTAGDCFRPESVVALFTQSVFCLQPRGDSPTRRSVFDSLVSGCIPVFFSPFTAHYQYPWHLPEDHRRYSIHIEEKEFMKGKVDVVQRLKEVSMEERAEMRRFIVHEVMPGLVYGDSAAKFVKFRDAFDIVVDNMLEKILQD